MSNHGFYRGRGSSVSNPIPVYIALCIFIFLLLVALGGILYAILMSIGFIAIIMFLFSARNRRIKEQELLDLIRNENEHLASEKKRMYSMKIYALNKDIAVLHTSFNEAAKHYSSNFKSYPYYDERDSMTGESFTIEDYEIFSHVKGQTLKSVKELIDRREITSPQIFYLKYLITNTDELNKIKLANAEQGNCEDSEIESKKIEQKEYNKLCRMFHEQYKTPFRYIPEYKPNSNNLKENSPSNEAYHNNKFHVVLLDDLDEGRLRRGRGNFLCSQSERLIPDILPNDEFEITSKLDNQVISCKKCIKILERWKTELHL